MRWSEERVCLSLRSAFISNPEPVSSRFTGIMLWRRLHSWAVLATESIRLDSHDGSLSSQSFAATPAVLVTRSGLQPVVQSLYDIVILEKLVYHRIVFNKVSVEIGLQSTSRAFRASQYGRWPA